MTDEMRIQQRPSALPYMLGGAALGAGAGLGVNQWTNFAKGTPMTHEDVIKEMNDNDKFEARTKEGVEHASDWKDVKAKQEAVKTAETELENAQKAKLPDTSKEAQELQSAKDKLKAEIEKLEKAESSKLTSSSKTTVSEFKVLTPDEIKDSVDVKGLKKYDGLYNDYQKALSTARKATGRPEAQAIEQFKNTMMKHLGNIHGASVTPTRTWRTALGSRSTTSDKQVARTVNQLKADIKAIIPDVTLSDKELTARGVDVKDKAAKKEYLNKVKARIESQRQAMLDEILGAEKRVPVYDAKGNLIRERLTYENVELIANRNAKYMKAVNKINSSSTLTATDKAKKIAELTKNRDADLAKYFGSIGHVQTLNENLESAILNDSGVRNTFNRIKSYIYGPGHEDLKALATTTTETSSLTAEEIAAKAKEYAEKNVGQSLKDDVTRLQQAYDEAAKKAGVVDEEAVKVAKEKVATAKGELEKAAKSLGEKFTVGGRAKWIAPVVGAVALGIGALACRPGAKEA